MLGSDAALTELVINAADRPVQAGPGDVDSGAEPRR